MDFCCKRCGYNASCKGNLAKHYKRKTECEPIYSDKPSSDLLEELVYKSLDGVGYPCEHCGKNLKTPSTKCKHKKICKHNPESINFVNHLEQKMDEMMNIIAKQQKEIESLKQKAPTSAKYISNQNNLGTINNTNNTNITINALGKEDISYLTSHPKFDQFMIKCIKEKMSGVCEFLVKKHFDPEHPENHNIRKLTLKSDFMDTYDGRKWKPRFTEDVLRDIFINIQTDFANFVDEAISENGSIKKMWLDNFMKEVGAPLDWDLSNSDYEFDGEVDEGTKEQLRDKIYKLACEYIYRSSKHAFSASQEVAR